MRDITVVLGASGGGVSCSVIEVHLRPSAKSGKGAVMARFGKVFYIIVGWFCVALGLLGVIMPLLPTTPFLLLAVWAFGKSSPALAERIRSHAVLGPPIRDWQDHGVIPLYAKVLALLMMTASAGYLWLKADWPAWVLTAVTFGFAAVSSYILSRPSAPKLPRANSG
jgi:uncharacterized protein